MTTEFTRRAAMCAGAAGLLGAAAAPAAARMPRSGAAADAISPEYPTTSLDRARAIVGASHANLERVQELLAEDPSLARASYDWGFGDWETALGAASHTGRPDIAEALIAHGARPDLFTFAMLDQVDVVRAFCEANPGVQRIPGPHGITLLAHARAGNAERVIAWLETLGGADDKPESLPLAPGELERYPGRYDFGPGEYDHWLVAPARRGGGLTIQRAAGTSRTLHRAADGSFHPAGAPHVTITFGPDGADGAATPRAATLTIEGAGPHRPARRAG